MAAGVGLAASCALLAACGGSGGSSAKGVSTTSSGKVSGNLTFYTYWLTDEADAAVAAFNKKYPDVHVKVYREGGPTIFQRFTAEEQTRRGGADVISIDEPYMKQLAADGYLERWLPQDASSVPDSLKTDSYVAVKSYINGVIVNTDVFPDKSQWPKSWEDFAHPKPSWDGKICLGDARSLSHAYSTLYGLYSTLGEERTKAIYQGLGRAHAKLYTGAPQASEQVTSGQCGMLFQIPFQNYTSIKGQGAHVAWVAPKPGMIPMVSSIGVVKDAANEDAAKAFVDFLLSNDGQKVFADLHLTPAQPDAPSTWWPSKDLGPYSPDMLIDYDEASANGPRQQLTQMWADALGVG